MAWYWWLALGIVVINLPTILRTRSRRKPPARRAGGGSSALDVSAILGAAGPADDRGDIDELAELTEEAVDLEGRGEFDMAVAGASHYQDNLSRIAGGKTAKKARLEVLATLVLEDDNRYDAKAVRVDIAGLTVGYLSKDDARAHRRRLKKAGRPGEDLTCRALIVGGWYRSKSDQGHFGVRLDI